jgi:hypothetical protein
MRCIDRRSCLSRTLARQKARPHAVGDLAEMRIDAGALDLVVADPFLREDFAAKRHRFAQELGRQQACRAIGARFRLNRPFSSKPGSAAEIAGVLRPLSRPRYSRLRSWVRREA